MNLKISEKENIYEDWKQFNAGCLIHPCTSRGYRGYNSPVRDEQGFPARTSEICWDSNARFCISYLKNGIWIVENNNLENSIETLTKELLPHIVDGTIIEGGNFKIREGNYKTHYLSTATFKTAVTLYKKVKNENRKFKLKRRVTLAFMIDDFSIKGVEFKLPDEYVRVLEQQGINQQEIFYFKESNLKNRSRNTLIRLLTKPDDAGITVEKEYSTDHDAIFLHYGAKSSGKKALVATVHKEALAPTPFGRMLLAQKLLDVEKKGYKLAINLMHEDSYEDKTGQFVDVCSKLGGKIKVINAYFKELDSRVIIDVTSHKIRLRINKKAPH